MKHEDLSKIEVPRLVKKPGAHKRVETHQELKDALDDGWVLRLDTSSNVGPGTTSPSAVLHVKAGTATKQTPAELPEPEPEPEPESDEKPHGRAKGDAAKKK